MHIHCFVDLQEEAGHIYPAIVEMWNMFRLNSSHLGDHSQGLPDICSFKPACHHWRPVECLTRRFVNLGSNLIRSTTINRPLIRKRNQIGCVLTLHVESSIIMPHLNLCITPCFMNRTFRLSSWADLHVLSHSGAYSTGTSTNLWDELPPANLTQGGSNNGVVNELLYYAVVNASFTVYDVCLIFHEGSLRALNIQASCSGHQR